MTHDCKIRTMSVSIKYNEKAQAWTLGTLGNHESFYIKYCPFCGILLKKVHKVIVTGKWTTIVEYESDTPEAAKNEAVSQIYKEQIKPDHIYYDDSDNWKII